MRRHAVLVSVALFAAFAVWARAQQPSGQAPVFRATIDLVHLDVSVLDKDRRPVRDLKPSDFTITEDGNSQPIVAFSAVDVPKNPPKPAIWSGRAAADVQSNEGMDDPQGRLFVLLMDDAMLPPVASSLNTARDVAKKFLDRITPNDRVAVVFSATGRNQGFTSDRARLVAAIDSLKVGHASHLMGWDTARDPKTMVTNVKGLDVAALVAAGTPPAFPVNPEIPGPVGDPDMGFRSASMETLQQVASTLISAPERRKALIYISPGMGLDKLSASIPVINAKDKLMTFKDSHRQLLGEMLDLFKRMQRANVTIYSIDPCGAGGLEHYVQSAASTLPALNIGQLDADDPALLNPQNRTQYNGGTFDWLNPGTVVPSPDQLAKHVSILTRDFLEEVANNTGGRAIVNTNAFDEGLDDIFAENSSYYLLGYQQPAGQKPGSQHSIRVKVNRPDVFIRTRSGYAVPEPPKPPKAGKPVVPVSPLDTAIVAAVPSAAFPMRLAAAPFMIPGQKNPTITLALGLTQPPVTARTTYKVDVQVNAYSTDGKARLVGHRDTATAILVPGKSRPRYELLTAIALPPGRYELRISAHRPLDNVDGSVYADVEVPDFTAPLAVSGVVVDTVPAGAVAPINAFDRFLPVVPTSNREFNAGQDVSVFLRVYQGGKNSAQPVEVKTRIVDELDAPIGTDGRDVIYGNQFNVGGRAADYRFALPIRRLAPGPYLLTLEVSLDKHSVTRTVQFTVVK
jgi:VWFA-related protein